MKKQAFVSTLTKIVLFTLLFTVISSATTKAEEKSLTLNKEEFFLLMNQSSSLNVKKLPKGNKVQFTSSDDKLCNISPKGKLKALLPGNCEIIAEVLNKKGKKIASLKAKVHISTSYLATNQKDLNKAHLSKKAESVILKPEKETRFKLPKGKHGYALLIDMDKSKKPLELQIGKDSSIREMILEKAKKASFQIENKLPSFIIRAEQAEVFAELSGKKGQVDSLSMDTEGSLSLSLLGKAKDKNGSKIYLSAKSKVKLAGKPLSPIFLFVKKEAEESEITTSVPLNFLSVARSTLIVEKNAKNVNITTLDYKTPVTVDNKTEKELSVTTPSLPKIVPANTLKTITGK